MSPFFGVKDLKQSWACCKCISALKKSQSHYVLKNGFQILHVAIRLVDL